VSTDFEVQSSRLIGMDGATDHPSLLVDLRCPGCGYRAG